MASGPVMAKMMTGRFRSRDVDRHIGAGPRETVGGAGATPEAVARLLALADGTGGEALLAALARLRAVVSADGRA